MCMSYKGKGVVKDIPYKTHGLASSILAASFGFCSCFQNCMSGIVNSKHAEIVKFMKKSMLIHDDQPGGHFFSDSPCDSGTMELELMFSIVDYLGFQYHYPE